MIAGIHRSSRARLCGTESDLGINAVGTRHEGHERHRREESFSALAHSRINVKMIDQGSSERNIIIGVKNADFLRRAIKAIYDIFISTEIHKWYTIYSSKPVRTEA